MRIKKYFLPCFLPVIAVLCFVFLSPAFADMKKVDETELAQANASVTGASIKEPIVSVDKNTVLWENDHLINSTERVFSPVVNKATEAINLNLNINGQETFNFYFEKGNSTITGPGITPAKH